MWKNKMEKEKPPKMKNNNKKQQIPSEINCPKEISLSDLI